MQQIFLDCNCIMQLLCRKPLHCVRSCYKNMITMQHARETQHALHQNQDTSNIQLFCEISSHLQPSFSDFKSLLAVEGAGPCHQGQELRQVIHCHLACLLCFLITLSMLLPHYIIVGCCKADGTLVSFSACYQLSHLSLPITYSLRTLSHTSAAVMALLPSGFTGRTSPSSPVSKKLPDKSNGAAVIPIMAS